MLSSSHVSASSAPQAWPRLSLSEQRRCWVWERKHYPTLSPAGQRRYQAYLAARGGRLLPAHAVRLPLSAEPFWLLEPAARFHRFRSAPQLPAHADVVIIGAGLTGASAFYHLRESGLHVVLLEEAERPCAQASGKNGGNFQLLAESYIGTYDGMVGERQDILRAHFPHLSAHELKTHAECDVGLMLDFTRRNLERFSALVKREQLDCDYSLGGWLQLASDAHEASAMEDDQQWLAAEEMTMVAPDALRTRLAGPLPFPGRFIFRSGNYHPVKFVHAVLRLALAQPKLQCFTGVKVHSLRQGRGTTIVETSEGRLVAGRVIVATNAFTPHVLPEYRGVVQCQASQMLNLEHVPHHLAGATVTERAGEIYYNSPAGTAYQRGRQHYGMLHYGTDAVGLVDDPYHVVRSGALFQRMLAAVHTRFPETRQQPASRCWAGPLGITSDRTPLIGWRHHGRVLMAVAFNGFGGSWCVEAGAVVADLAVTGADLAPEARMVFSPCRFFPPATQWRPTAVV